MPSHPIHSPPQQPYYSRVEHDLGHEHVFERQQRLAVLDAVVALERLVEVGVGRLEVALVGGVQHARLHVQRGLHLGRRVDAVGGGAGRGERRASLGQVAERVVRLGLEKLDLRMASRRVSVTAGEVRGEARGGSCYAVVVEQTYVLRFD